MKFVAIGRTRLLVRAIEVAIARGHELVGILTCRAAPEYGVEASDFAELAARLAVPFRNDPRVNTADARSWLAGLSADAAISVNWPTRIGAEARAIFRHGVLNAHAGDLPRYRGNACPNWAILQGELEMGISVFEMADELDDGAILIKRKAPIADSTTVGDLYAFLEVTLPEMFAEAIDGLETGELKPTPQPVDPALALRCYPRRPEDSEIDWTQAAFVVDRMVRASSEPFAGATTWLDGRRARVWRAEIATLPHSWVGAPGQVAHRDGEDGVVVLCGQGALRLLEIEIEGVGRARAGQLVASVRARFGINPSVAIAALEARVAQAEALLSNRREG